MYEHHSQLCVVVPLHKHSTYKQTPLILQYTVDADFCFGCVLQALQNSEKNDLFCNGLCAHQYVYVSDCITVINDHI